MNARLFKRIFLWTLLVSLAVIGIVLLTIYIRQDEIVQSQIAALNQTYEGEISVGDVHLDPFKSFPYVSLKIDDVQVLENKNPNASILLDVADIYVGFSIWEVATGNYNIHSLLIENGVANLVLHADGATNLQNALEEKDDAAPEELQEIEEALDFSLDKIELRNLDLHKLQEEENRDVETYIYWANGGLRSEGKNISAHVDSEFELNVIDNGDTTYLKHKHFEFHTDLIYDQENSMLNFKPSGITMEHGDFQLEGSVEMKDEYVVDISVQGTKPSFDMFIAFAPEELIPVLERYNNAGDIYFNAAIQGPTAGTLPFIDANFGAKEAYLENTTVKKRIDGMGFVGHFTNGEARDLSTMEFSLKDIVAKLDKGTFIGDVLVKNFESPEIDMQVDADFELPFLVSFLNLEDIDALSGSVEMEMSFHDIIDLDNPERALQDLNQAYFAELRIEDFTLRSSDLPADLDDLDVHLEMQGKKAILDQFDVKFGNSQLSVQGSLSDLPAIVHHAPTPVQASISIESELLDLVEITGFSEADSSGVNERIKNLRLAFSFDAFGNAFTEFKHLPIGEFFIDDLYADLEHYPHTLHDFHADILVKDEDLKVVDLTGVIDQSDFHFNGLIHDYSFWMHDELEGDIDLDITLRSDLLQLEDLLSYQGVNHMPEDYRHEEIEDLNLHMESTIHYADNELVGVELQLDDLTGKMHVHPLKLEKFKGRFEFVDEHLVVENFTGKMGRSTFDIDMNYYLGDEEELKIRDNIFTLRSPFIDFDALSNFEVKSAQKPEDPTEVQKEHEEAFNIYELPFSDMQFNLDVDHFIYHRLDLQDITGQIRTTHDHYIYLDTISLDAAGGHIAMNGYFNGSNPEEIYLKPNMILTGVDLDRLLFKFENFGQDAIVSENLHGKLNSTITGNIRMFPDFVVDLDRSEVHLDAQVLDGRLENYEPILLLSDYLGDKDLTSIRFDTLQNHMDFMYGEVTIPNMTIESTLGHMDLSGTQHMDGTMNYYARIPWSLVKSAARTKMFGAASDSTENEIVELDPTRKQRYLNVNVVGTMEDFDVKLKKKRD